MIIMKAPLQRRNWREYLPASVECIPLYNFNTISADFMAAIIVAIAALPLSMGYAIAAGLPPHIGIYCTIVPGFIVALLGGSKVQISGAAVGFEAFVIMLMGNHGPNGLFTCLALAGVMVMLIGLTGLGSIVKVNAGAKSSGTR